MDIQTASLILNQSFILKTKDFLHKPISEIDFDLKISTCEGYIYQTSHFMHLLELSNQNSPDFQALRDEITLIVPEFFIDDFSNLTDNLEQVCNTNELNNIKEKLVKLITIIGLSKSSFNPSAFALSVLSSFQESINEKTALIKVELNKLLQKERNFVITQQANFELNFMTGRKLLQVSYEKTFENNPNEGWFNMEETIYTAKRVSLTDFSVITSFRKIVVNGEIDALNELFIRWGEGKSMSLMDDYLERKTLPITLSSENINEFDGFPYRSASVIKPFGNNNPFNMFSLVNQVESDSKVYVDIDKTTIPLVTLEQIFSINDDETMDAFYNVFRFDGNDLSKLFSKERLLNSLNTEMEKVRILCQKGPRLRDFIDKGFSPDALRILSRGGL